MRNKNCLKKIIYYIYFFKTKFISTTKPFLALWVIFLVVHNEAPLLFYTKLVTLYNLYKLLLVIFKI
jgi:hypothetical protein